jgi:hypothetical protein
VYDGAGKDDRWRGCAVATISPQALPILALFRKGETVMLFLRLLAVFVGLLGIAVGLLWVAQGTGILSWPNGSLMLDDRGWAIRGAVMTAVGAILLWLARRGNETNNNHL